jgi:hypothetical protein
MRPIGSGTKPTHANQRTGRHVYATSADSLSLYGYLGNTLDCTERPKTARPHATGFRAEAASQ